VIDDLYQGFVDVVDKGRPKLDRETIEKLADGRIYSANQALAAGLVDEIGHLADALERARILAGISQAKVVTYRAAGQTANNIYSDISSAVPAPVEFNVLSLGASKIPAGFYYLWPMALSR
jgi:protease-4